MTERKALGKGLAALIPPREATAKKETAGEVEKSLVRLVPLEKIRPNPQQPRRTFDQVALNELAQSISEKGILQPLLLRQSGDGYSLIAGERRFEASKLAGLSEVPAIVRQVKVTPGEDLELALIENIQREDLNSIEEARAMRQLVDEYGLTQEEVGRRLGRDRSTVANTLRLLKLPPDLLPMVEDGSLSAGAARSILSLEITQQLEIGRLAREKGLSVREIERMVARLKKGRPTAKKVTPSSPAVKVLEEQLKRHLATKVNITPKGQGGVVQIEYYSQADLSRIFKLLNA